MQSYGLLQCNAKTRNRLKESYTAASPNVRGSVAENRCGSANAESRNGGINSRLLERGRFITKPQ